MEGIFSLDHCAVKFLADLTDHSWLRTGGFAECLVETNHPQAIQSIYQHCYEHNIFLRTIARGTNCLITDGVLSGMTFRYIPTMWWEEDDQGIWVDASIPIPTLITILHKSSRIGLEFAAGIPGTVGGCIKMNAGTSLGEFKDVFLRGIFIDQSGQFVLTRDQIQMQYRTTNISSNQYIWKVLLNAPKVSATQLEHAKRTMREYLQYRHQTQPLDLPTLGSTFKNPPHEDRTAGYLIEQAGLSGYQIGGIQISPRHANFLVNTGKGTAKDALDVIRHVQEKVLQKFRVQLDLEVQILY